MKPATCSPDPQSPRASVCLSVQWPRAWRVPASRGCRLCRPQPALCHTVHLAPGPIRHHLGGCALKCGGQGRAGDAFRNGNRTHLFMIYSLTLNGNPMGPIKAPPSPNSYLKSAGASPVLWRQMHLRVEQTALLPHPMPPPSLLPAFSTFERLLTVPKISWGCQPFRAVGQEGRGPCFRGREGPRTRIFQAQDRQREGASDGGEIQFSIFLKRKMSA